MLNKHEKKEVETILEQLGKVYRMKNLDTRQYQLFIKSAVQRLQDLLK